MLRIALNHAGVKFSHLRSKTVARFVTSVLASILVVCAAGPAQENSTHKAGEKGMSLGNFSVSLTVRDLAASRAFYEKLGFHAVSGDSRRMVILQNDTSTIGLFQGFFEKNILTFNPGWDRSCATLPEFDDVREIQKTLKSRGLTPTVAADESSTGPASLVLMDPDGNQILIDQHVPRPHK